MNSQPVTFTELSSNSGLFSNYDESDVSNLAIATDAARGVSASIDYNETPKTILVGFDFGTIDIQLVDDEWNSGEEIPVVLVDGDANLNSRVDEDLDLNNPDIPLIPSLGTGDPFTLGEGGVSVLILLQVDYSLTILLEQMVQLNPLLDFVVSILPQQQLMELSTQLTATVIIDKFSDRAIINHNSTLSAGFDARSLIIDLGVTAADLQDSINPTEGNWIFCW